MKKSLFYIVSSILFGAVTFTSCLEDKSEYGGIEVADITVSGIESKYEAVSFVGQTLSINPVVETGYQNLKYEWLLLSKNTGELDSKGDTIQPVLLSEEKNLNIEVNLAPTVYQLRFRCIADNGYILTTKASLSVVTEFSKGFYIMKETASGDTDLDLLPSSGVLTTDILTNVHGAPLKGAPLKLGINYEGFYINEETDAMEGVHQVTVTTQGGDFGLYRSTDMKLLFDRSNIKFEEMTADENVIAVFTNDSYELMFTNKGIYGIGNCNDYCKWYPEWFPPNSGRFPLPASTGFSPYFTFDFTNASGNGIFWDAEEHSIKVVNSGGGLEYVTDAALNEIDAVLNMAGTECVYMGTSNRQNISYAILEKGGARQMIRFEGKYIRAIWGYILAYNDVLDIPAGSHLASSDIITCCGLQAPYVYCMDGGKLYATNVQSDALPEMELPLSGIGAGETVTYLSNQYINYTFDYLVVGTTTGSDYKLYFYEMNNGIPTGDPVQVVSGKGKVRGVRYLTDEYSSYATRSVID